MDRGVLAALTGFDITSSLSMNNMWFPEFKESPTAQASMLEYLTILMGPFASLAVKQVPRAIDKFNEGKLLEGVEQLLPAMARSPVTSYRYMTEGAATTWGAQIKPAAEFTIGQIIGQALGFSTEGLTMRREDLFKANALRLQVENEKRQLMNRLDVEFRGEKDVTKALDEIMKFNRRNWFNPINSEDISKSLLNRLKRALETERGLQIEPKYYPQLYNLMSTSKAKLETESTK